MRAGRGALFLSHLTGCKVEGIDWVPKFIRKATSVADSTKPRPPVRFRQENMEEADLGEATFVYLYGTCLSDEAIWALIGRFKKLSPAAKIITGELSALRLQLQVSDPEAVHRHFSLGGGGRLPERAHRLLAKVL